jgi:hypothetical protein
MATDTWIELNMTALHLAHVPYTEVTGRLQFGQTTMQSDFVAFIEAGTLHKPSLFGVELSQEIEEQVGVPVSCTTIKIYVPCTNVKGNQLIRDWLTIVGEKEDDPECESAKRQLVPQAKTPPACNRDRHQDADKGSRARKQDSPHFGVHKSVQ